MAGTEARMEPRSASARSLPVSLELAVEDLTDLLFSSDPDRQPPNARRRVLLSSAVAVFHCLSIVQVRRISALGLRNAAYQANERIC